MDFPAICTFCYRLYREKTHLQLEKSWIYLYYKKSLCNRLFNLFKTNCYHANSQSDSMYNIKHSMYNIKHTCSCPSILAVPFFNTRWHSCSFYYLIPTAATFNNIQLQTRRATCFRPHQIQTTRCRLPSGRDLQCTASWFIGVTAAATENVHIHTV